MKKIILFLFAAVALCCSWMVKPANVNTWRLQIGKTEILSSQKNNMGDTITLQKKKLKASDTLYVQRYLCGYTAESAITVLTLKNAQDGIIKTVTNKNNGTMQFSAALALNDIYASADLDKGKMISVYFTISSRAEKLKETVLVGVIKLK